VQAPVREAGGDNEVPRDKLGRPRIRMRCIECTEIPGKIPSPKTGKPIQCPKCKGAGELTRSYTRTTTYIDVLDDKSNLMTWGERMVLIGIDREPSLLEEVGALYESQLLAEKRLKMLPKDASAEEVAEAKAAVKEPKDALNRKAKIAKLKAGAEDKADKGTALHGLSELVDQGIELPKGIDFGDVIDMDAYKRATAGLKIVHMEKLVVHDDLQVAGTPDRVSEWHGANPLIAPDGYKFGPGELLITDLKTGTVEYGALKMAMQLSLYSRSKLYDPSTGERTPLGNINQSWGLIMNAPAGMGECTLYWADLRLGWRAIEVAAQVRELRNKGGSCALIKVA
jgi:hypothetical protein